MKRKGRGHLARWATGIFTAGCFQLALALTPLPDTRPAFFAGDWVGTGSNDTACFVRLHEDGRGEIYLQGANGERQGTRIRWRNDRQNLLVLEVQVLPRNPALRLGPFGDFTLRNGVNLTLSLNVGKQISCELQPRQSVLERLRDLEGLSQKLEEAERGKAR